MFSLPCLNFSRCRLVCIHAPQHICGSIMMVGTEYEIVFVQCLTVHASGLICSGICFFTLLTPWLREFTLSYDIEAVLHSCTHTFFNCLECTWSSKLFLMHFLLGWIFCVNWFPFIVNQIIFRFFFKRAIRCLYFGSKLFLARSFNAHVKLAILTRTAKTGYNHPNLEVVVRGYLNTPSVTL